MAGNDDDLFISRTTYPYVVREIDTLFLDFYSPSAPRSDSACVVYFYGGGFISGSRDDKQTCLDVDALLSKGFAVAAVDYRKYLSVVDFSKTPKHHLLDLLDTTVSMAAADCAAAVSFVASYAKALSISASKIILTGSSAGGIAVLQYDYERLLNSNVSKGVSLKDSCLNIPECSLPAEIQRCVAVTPVAVVSFAGAVYSHAERLKYLDVSNYPANMSRPAPTAFFYGSVDKVVPRKHIRLFGSHFVGSQKLSGLFARLHFDYKAYRFVGHGHEVCNYLNKVIDNYVEFVDIVLSNRLLSGVRDCCYDFLPVTKASKLTLLGILTSDNGFEGLFDEE